GNVVASARHMAYRGRSQPTVVSATARMDGAGEDIAALVGSLEPRYLERVVPSPYGPDPQSREVLRVAHRDARIHQEKKCGSASVVFGETAEGFQRLGRIDTHGAIFRVCDFVLPYAQRLESGT